MDEEVTQQDNPEAGQPEKREPNMMWLHEGQTFVNSFVIEWNLKPEETKEK